MWLRLQVWLEERLADARRRNDSPKLSEQETAVLRGEIKTLNRIIALGKDPPMTGDGDQPLSVSRWITEQP